MAEECVKGDVTMHSELSRRDKVSMMWLAIHIVAAAVIFMMINTLLVRTGLNSAATDTMIIIVCIVGVHWFVRQNFISYKYCMIEEDLIVHQLIGSKEKRIIDLKADQIVEFGLRNSQRYKDIRREQYGSRKRLYNCIKESNVCYLIYEADEEKHLFTFQPSDYLSELIKAQLEKARD